ncbi:MAG TPA: HD domain-containing phosphohydrolase [Alphaproteobacteria bacterium]|nr:HD domain-containing phosphohydrolase [Alphaproteobacteria bacterium]
MTVGTVALLLAIVAAVALAMRLVEEESERDLRVWQARLGVLADSRATAVGDWLERQVEVANGLAQNASLQIYVTELALAGGDRAGVTDEAAQAEYLRNLLVVTADRTGFASGPLGPRVGANVPRIGTAGLAIVDAQARVLVATPDMPAIDARIRDFIAGGPAAPAVLDVYAGPGGQPTMAFYAPVTGLQADPGTPPVAGVLGIKPIAGELFPLLTRPPTSERTTETVLVRRAGATIEFISPAGDSAPLERRLAVDTPNLAEAFAMQNPGGFGLHRDYRDREVLVTGRAVAPVSWTLVHKIDRGEALAESDARLHRLIAMMVLGVAVIAAGLIAAWRHGASRRATATAERLRHLSQKLEQQAKLLRIVTDSQPAAIFIVDDQDHVRFANRLMAERAGGEAAGLVGKTLANALGPAAAARHHRMAREALERGSSQPAVQRLEDGGKVRVVHIEYIPLPRQPDERPTVLVVEEDITAPIMERERRERTQRHVVQTLVALLDSRDPFAANHSQRVAAVARAIADEMGLSTAEVETAETAASLMNIGKVLVEPHVLTRSGELSDDERQQVRQSLLAGADLLAGIEFDGPVVEALRHSQERWAGDGPGGLQGDAIPMVARIIAVANAFVAMISPRAHRVGISIDAAVAGLQEQCGKAFDRRVVAALVNALENRGGREQWAAFVKPTA